MLHTEEIFSKFDALNSAVCCTPRRLSPWCDAHCTLPRLTPRCATHRGIISTECCTPRRFFEILSPNFAVCSTPRRLNLRCAAHHRNNFVNESLDEIETEFENSSACLSGAHIGTNHEKNWRAKIPRHTPSKQISSHAAYCFCYYIIILLYIIIIILYISLTMVK